MLDFIRQLKTRLQGARPQYTLQALPPDKIAQIREAVPGIPEDYLLFMQLIGYGSIGNFMIYSGPVPAAEIYDAALARSLAGVVLVGDNFSGDCFGYDTNNWQLVEFDSACASQPLDDATSTFIDLITNRYLSDP